ncbi:SusC/RagA family TonB-linked outer membrane protein [Cyclobacterium qasimii]|uniref:TonB-dependent receptor n=2 Tax=Cyclobacterium qasimii TaxID=1350429 RepID=S7WT79_9BACT|nr:TonB-dependent receptor [Cyclobacterium qasimii]EPR67298.1 TonB-dependent receptor [Cyclobacterium qasimii M12-11B]
MKKSTRYLILLLVLLGGMNFGNAFAQGARVLNGTVSGQNGQSIPGATILVKGTTNGTVTDMDGKYSLSVGTDAQVLIVSFVGMLTSEVTIGNRSQINVTLEEETADLDEFVVIGYGTQKKATLTGSVTSVESEQVISNPSVNLTNSLSGLLPGLVAMNRSGEPGADNSTILIRGSNTTGDNSPFVVVDGVQNPPGWQRINPNDIESISVLKDASAAIYGARAANGVILITTKRGTAGKPTLSYTFNQGISQPTRLPELAGSPLFAGYVNEMMVKDGQDPRYSDAEIELFRNGTDPNYSNTNWYDEVLKDYSLQSMHNLSLRGGSESVRYSMSGSYSHQNSIFKEGVHDFKGYTIRSNIDADVNEYITVNLDLNLGMDDRSQPGTENPWGWLNAIPMMPVYYQNGYPSAGIEQGLNPAVMTTSASGDHNTKTKRAISKVGFNVKAPWVEGLGMDGYFVYSNEDIMDKNWRTPWTVYNYDMANDAYIPLRGGRITAPELTQSTQSVSSTFLNFRIKYERQYGDHYINSFIGAEQTKGGDAYYEAFRRNYLSPTLSELFAGDPATQQNDGVSSESSRQSILGRLSYNYQEKYIIDFNARYDGSYVFPEGKRFGFFPGVSAAWVLSEEFLKDVSGINDLKLRTSVGKMGNDRISPFQFMPAYSLGLNGYHFGLPTTSQLGVVPGVTPNPNVTWEVATTYNIGLDGMFWNGGLSFTLEAFKQRRTNILTKRDLEVPFYTGLQLPDENIGIVENKGLELALSHRGKASSPGGFSYTVGGNIAFNKNKIIDISEAQDVPDYQKAEGSILGAGLYYEALGIFRTQEEVDSNPVYPGTLVGHLQYTDVNNDGIISSQDMVRMDKSNIPQITFGINGTLNYGQFSLFANFSGQGGAWQYYHQNARIAVNGLAELIENRYTAGSMDSKYPILPDLETRTQPSGLQSTFWLQNASFLRFKTLQVGYNLPETILKKLGVSTARVYLNGNNLLTISEIKWFDPEGDNERGSFYPQSRIFNLGVDLSF